MLSLSLAAAPAAANEPLPKTFAVDDQRLIREYAQAFKAAMDGSCYVLLAMVRPEEIDWGTPSIGMMSDNTPDITESFKTRWRMFAAIQMYDRALCVPFDPTRAIDVFERWQTEISRTGIGAARAKLELGWRLWEGFGAPMDRARVRDVFREKAHRFHHSDFFSPELRDPALILGAFSTMVGVGFLLRGVSIAAAMRVWCRG